MQHPQFFLSALIRLRLVCMVRATWHSYYFRFWILLSLLKNTVSDKYSSQEIRKGVDEYCSLRQRSCSIWLFGDSSCKSIAFACFVQKKKKFLGLSEAEYPKYFNKIKPQELVCYLNWGSWDIPIILTMGEWLLSLSVSSQSTSQLLSNSWEIIGQL